MTQEDRSSIGAQPAPRWRLIGAVGGVVVAAALVIAVVALSDDENGQAADGPSPSAVAGASESPTPSASEAASPSIAATPAPTAVASAGIPDEWSVAATFAVAGRRYVFGDVVSSADGLVAVGTLYASEDRAVFGPPPDHTGVVWRSTDGTEWVDTTPASTFDQVELTHLYEGADGDLILIGDTWVGVERTSAAWASQDGATWEPIAFEGMPSGAWIARVASGVKGHLATAHVGGEARALYSSDGRRWEATLTDASAINETGAGDDGFVASIFRGDGAPLIVASSDGRAWVDSSDLRDGAFIGAPRGGDWLAITTTFGDVIRASSWASENGLEWSPLGAVALETVESPDVSCREIPAFLHGLPSMVLLGTVLSGPCSEGAVVTAGGSYASTDGAEWSRLPFGDQATVAGAVQVGDRFIAVTDTRTNRAPEVGVTFWIGEAP